MLSTIRVIIGCNTEVCVFGRSNREDSPSPPSRPSHFARSVTMVMVVMVILSRYTFWKMHMPCGSDRHRFKGSFLAKILCGGEQRSSALATDSKMRFAGVCTVVGLHLSADGIGQRHHAFSLGKTAKTHQ